RTALTAGSRSFNSDLSPSTPRAGGRREQKDQKRAEAEVRKAAAKAKREKDAHIHAVEMKIAALEGRQKELITLLEDPVSYETGGNAIAINRELSAVTDELARLTS